MFQSTRPRGARRARSAPRKSATPSFNPRAREGRDADLIFCHIVSIIVSIHAPARGATR